MDGDAFWSRGYYIDQGEGLILLLLGLMLACSRWISRFVDRCALMRTAAAGMLILAALLAPVIIHRQAAHSQILPSPRLLASASSAESLRFALLGDVGRASPAEYRIGRQLRDLNLEQRISALLLLGDNIYDHDEYSRAIEERVINPLSPALDAGVPMHAILGNHDYSGGYAAAEIADPRLGMEGSRYYQWHVGDGLCTFLMLDTETLEEDPDQYQWMKSVLETDTSRWLIVLGHRPPYASSVGHGSALEIRELIEAADVNGRPIDLFVSGHNHLYERRLVPESPAVAITIGSSGKVDDADWPTDSDRLAYDSDHEAFLLLDISREAMEGRVVGPDGATLDTFTIRKPVPTAS